MSQATVTGVKRLFGTIQVPGDKSISHRALLFSALAEGTSRIKGILKGADVLSTWGCLQALGVDIEEQGDTVVVHGVGLHGLKAPTQILNCGNSGTTMRLLMGILAGQPFSSRLTGDASLNQRPMGRVIEPLTQMGAQIEEMRAGPKERVIRIDGRPLRGMRYPLPMASAQVKSALLLAGIYASGTLEIVEPMPSRNHSELMLMARGLTLNLEADLISLSQRGNLQALDTEIPGDLSSAAFFLVALGMVPEGEVTLQGVGINPTRIGILEVLKGMGADIQISRSREWGGEPVADLVVRPAPLKGAQIFGAVIPKMIDEIPVFCVAASQASGETVIRDAQELRVKESDRITAVVEEFNKLSINISELKDGMRLIGPQSVKGGHVLSHGDHRMAMALAIAGLGAEADVIIDEVESVEVSYPGFWEDYRRLGGQAQIT